MRSELEIMDLVMNVAKNDERVRAVFMQGSRTNPNAAADRFQDFDFNYYVTDLEPFKNHAWIDIFGSDRIMFKVFGNKIRIYCMLFADGNRIDIGIIPREVYENGIEDKGESVLLYTKDDCFKPLPAPTHHGFYVKPPNESEYDDTCNTFWFFTQCVAKGICRDELPYAQYWLNRDMRDNFHKMIEWYIGQKTNFSVSAGKYGKYFKLYLDSRQYDMFCKTYADCDYKNIWNSLFTMCELFREFALNVKEFNKFIYPKKDDENMTVYLKHIQGLYNYE